MIDERQRDRVILALEVAVGIMVAYWVAWFVARSAVASNTTKGYYDFENAFPLADAWLTLCMASANVTLRRQSSSSLFWLLAGGGAGVYLFCMDVLYDLEHGIWWKSGGGLIELGINIVTLVFSVWLMRWGWSNRRALLRDG